PAAPDVERPVRDAGPDALGEHGPGPRVGPRQQDHELLAAVPGRDVAAAYPRADPPRDSAQHVVADEVAEAIVDRLEMVDVDHQARERSLLAAAPRELLLEAGLEIVPVAPARQRIGQPALHEAGTVRRVLEGESGDDPEMLQKVRGVPARKPI